MPSSPHFSKPGLASFLHTVRNDPVESSIDYLISLLKRRQIRGSRACAVATAHLLRQLVNTHRASDVSRLISLLKQRQIRAYTVATAHLLRQLVNTHRAGDVSRLIERVREVGQRLVSAQHNELAIGNILRRILRVIRDEAEEEREWEITAADDAESESRTDTPMEGDNVTSTDNDNNLSEPTRGPSLSSPLHQASDAAYSTSKAIKDIRAELVDGIDEIIDELDQVDEQIAGYALEHIHSNEILLTHASSITVQKFLLKVAAKRKFTLFHAESFPNDHEATHATVTGRSKIVTEDKTNFESFHKPLAAAGITVILIPDSAVFAVMSRVNKVILDTNVVLANGGLVTTAGSKTIAKAANFHRTPVVVLSGVYQLSPETPSDVDSLIEYGDASKVFAYEDGNLVKHLDVENPLDDYVPPELVDLFITNLGGNAPTCLDRIISDHYRSEDMKLSSPQ